MERKYAETTVEKRNKSQTMKLPVCHAKQLKSILEAVESHKA